MMLMMLLMLIVDETICNQLDTYMLSSECWSIETLHCLGYRCNTIIHQIHWDFSIAHGHGPMVLVSSALLPVVCCYLSFFFFEEKCGVTLFCNT
nr:hypothetical protein CFP56_05002 [Quercus suber]